MTDLYVYYKVNAGDAARLAPLLAAMQRGLADEHGVAVQLKRRPAEKDGLQTWMEVYPGVGDGFEAALEHAVERAGILALLAGPRHAEVFMDVAPCA